MKIFIIAILLVPGIIFSNPSQDPSRETLFSIGGSIGNYNLRNLNLLLAQNNYKPLPENWKFLTMTIRRNVLKSSHFIFLTYGISPNFDHYEASLNQIDYKYLNASIGFLQTGWSRRMNIGSNFSVSPLIAYRTDIMTMGYGRLSGSLSKNLQNPTPGQRSTGFIFSVIAGLNLEKAFCLNKFPSIDAPFRFLVGLSIQSGLPVGRYYWYSNYSSLSGERYLNRLCGGFSISFYL